MKTCCGYSLEAPQKGASNEYPQRMFSSRNKKNIDTLMLTKNALSRAIQRTLENPAQVCLLTYLPLRIWTPQLLTSLILKFEQVQAFKCPPVKK